MVCFPEKGDVNMLEQMLAGGLSKMVEANCTVIGGHSIRDEEIKLGYSVTGTVHPGLVLTNSGAKPGDRLIFTKAIGTGVISTAIKRGHAKEAWVRAAVKAMTTLNKLAAEVVTSGGFEVHAMTDVTGFGLIGHVREVARGSGVSVRLFASKVPLLEGALECVRAGDIPGGLKANRNFAEGCVQYADDVPEAVRTLLHDPQTAGGLLISVGEKDAKRLAEALKDAGAEGVTIGEAIKKTGLLIQVLSS
jgi:selenide,water dikinase